MFFCRPLSPQEAALAEQWKAIQQSLRQKMVIAPLPEIPRFVAGADVAFSRDMSQTLAVALVYDRVDRKVVEIASARRPNDVPYIPGFLSFREGPALIDAINQLQHPYGVICFDGQGIAHPRRCGLATHISVLLEKPGIGVAKSRLTGTFTDPPPEAGSSSPLVDHNEQIGLVLRSKTNTRPLFISVGHRVDLDSAVRVVLACCTRYRIPEPTRQADIEVARLKQQIG